MPAPAPPTPLLRPRRRYHFGPSGLLYIFVSVLIALGAFNSQNNLLYWTFGFALALLIVSGVISGAMLMGLRVEREWVSGASVGHPLHIRYKVRNTNRLIPAFALTIEELGFEQTDPAPAKPSLFTRLLNFLLPRKPVPAANPALPPPRAFVAHVGAKETVHVESIVRARRRGPISFSAIIVHTSFPFGLMRKSVIVPQHAATVIIPEPAPGSADVLRSASRTGQLGATSRRPGRGDEFFALREYRHGDSPRDVAWRATAKRGRLLVRQFAAPAPSRLWIVLHLRPRPGSDAADEHAIRIAAGLAHSAEAHNMEYALSIPFTRLLVHPRRGPGHLSRMMTDLGLIELGDDDGRGTRSHFPPQAAGRSQAGATCIVIHAGPIDPAFAPPADQAISIAALPTDAPIPHSTQPQFSTPTSHIQHPTSSAA